MSARYLEVLSLPAQQPQRACPPLLLVHGAYTAAWCWQEHYLAYFSAAGYAVHALSLSGHGASAGRDCLDRWSISDYVADVAAICARLPTQPVLIGHSMGGFVVQKLLEQQVAPAAVLLCAPPPQGTLSSMFSLIWQRPQLFADLNQLLIGGQPNLPRLRAALFAQEIEWSNLCRYASYAQAESLRAIWDMAWPAPARPQAVCRTPLCVLGAGADALIPPAQVEWTARSYGQQATLFPGFGHALMLEPGWEGPAQHILDWLEETL